MPSGYFLLDPRTNDVKYVGITSHSLVRRYQRHVWEAARGLQTHKHNWIKQLQTIGTQPILSPQATFETMKEARIWEIATIALLRNVGCKLTNTTGGGEGQLGVIQSEEDRQKRSKALQGKKHSEQRRQNISRALKGRKLTPEHCQHLSDALKG